MLHMNNCKHRYIQYIVKRSAREVNVVQYRYSIEFHVHVHILGNRSDTKPQHL